MKPLEFVDCTGLDDINGPAEPGESRGIQQHVL